MVQEAFDLKRRSMLKSLITEMTKEGIKVTHASMEGYKLLPAIGRYRPDVIGMYDDGRGVVGIVRMGGEDIDSAAGRQQIKDLAKRISQRDIDSATRRQQPGDLRRTFPAKHRPVPLYIAIPARVSKDLEVILQQVGLLKEEGKKLVFAKDTDIRIRTY